MKIKLIALMLVMIFALKANSQLTYNVKNKSSFKGENKKPASIKIGDATFITHLNTRGETVVMYKKNNKTTVLNKFKLIPSDEVEVTGFDMDGDKKPEILVFYTTELTNLQAVVYSGKDYKRLGLADYGGSYALLKNSKIYFEIPHHEITEHHIYFVKNGKLVFDEKNSVY